MEIPKGAKELSHKPHGRKQNYDEIKEHFFVTKSFLDFRKQLFYFHFYRILSEVDLLKNPFFINKHTHTHTRRGDEVLI